MHLNDTNAQTIVKKARRGDIVVSPDTLRVAFNDWTSELNQYLDMKYAIPGTYNSLQLAQQYIQVLKTRAAYELECDIWNESN